MNEFLPTNKSELQHMKELIRNINNINQNLKPKE